MSNVPTDQLNLPSNLNYSLPGQIWSPDDICKQANGLNSSFCQSFSSNICLQLWCRTSPTSSGCTTLNPAPDGTICGSGQVCSKGYCVSSPLAPVGSCPFGEGVVTQSLTSITIPNNNGYMSCSDFCITINIFKLYFFKFIVFQ